MKIARLIYECDANWYYATEIPASDPAIWYQDPSGKTHLPTNSRDLAEYKAHAKADFVHDWDIIRHEIASTGKPYSMVAIIEWLIAKDPIDILEVPVNFPAALFNKLHQAGIPIKTYDAELFFSQRAIKSLVEVEKMAEAQRINEQGYHHAMSVLRQSDIARDNTLVWQGKPLTSEILRAEFNKKLIDLGVIRHVLGTSIGPVVAGGIQASMPHERGHGALKAHELIIIDSFPTAGTFYNADCTRTFVKGKPTQWQHDVYHAVWGAQMQALGLIQAGANGQDIQKAVESFFNQAGFPTGKDNNGNPYGFVHSLGHGVGLEVHDPGPRMLTRADCILQSGYVTSVEPGLYYPSSLSGKGNVGGCRIEDVVVVTDHGHHNLTTFPKDKWIID